MLDELCRLQHIPGFMTCSGPCNSARSFEYCLIAISSPAQSRAAIQPMTLSASSSYRIVACRLVSNGLSGPIRAHSWASRQARREASTPGRALLTTRSSYWSSAQRKSWASLSPSGCFRAATSSADPSSGTTWFAKSTTSAIAWFAPSPRSVT
jgi:hypothetical protein